MRARLLPMALTTTLLDNVASAQVPIPVPSARAFEFHEQFFWLWAVGQIATLAVPLWLLLSGRGATIASRCLALCRGRVWLATVLFGALAGALYAVASVAADLLRMVRLAPYVGTRPPDVAGWLQGQIVPTVGLVVALALAGCVLNAVIRRSPRWCWLWVAGGLTLAASLYLMVLPIVDAQQRAYPRIEATAHAQWLPRIAALGARANAHDVPVLVRPTRDGEPRRLQNSAIGLGPTRAIVLSDQIFTQWTPEMVDVAAAHELKHYLFDNTWLPPALIAGLSTFGALLIFLEGNFIVRRFSRHLGFGSLAEPAALPLLLALLQLYLLIGVPAFHLYAQKVELDADRFALELTHDNLARGLVSSTTSGDLWLAEDPLFERLYVNTHPSMADRVRLANSYRPWETGDPGP